MKDNNTNQDSVVSNSYAVNTQSKDDYFQNNISQGQTQQLEIQPQGHNAYFYDDHNQNSAWRDDYFKSETQHFENKEIKANQVSSPVQANSNHNTSYHPNKFNNAENYFRDDSPQQEGNINTIKTHFSVRNLYLPSDMRSETDLEKLIMDIFYKKYDMPLKSSKIIIESSKEAGTEKDNTYACKIGFKYVTDAVKLYDKAISIEYKLFPFRISGHHFEPSTAFNKFVVSHKERMKNKPTPKIPNIVSKRSSKSRSDSKNGFKEREERIVDK